MTWDKEKQRKYNRTYHAAHRHPCRDCGTAISPESVRCRSCATSGRNVGNHNALGHAVSAEARAKIGAASRRTRPLAERIAEKTDANGYWTGGTSSPGYPLSSEGRKHIAVHRWVWAQANGPIPPGMCILHLDDNPLNVNLSNLRIGTPSENVKDCRAKGRNGGGSLVGHLVSAETRAKIGAKARARAAKAS